MQNCRFSEMKNPFIAYSGYMAAAFVSAAVVAGAFALVLSVNKATVSPDDCKFLLATSEDGGRPCPPDWIGYQKKCFYFSNEEGSWTYGRDFCSLHNASLAIIGKEEKGFVLRYKGTASHWIGLKRDPEQPWKWVDGTASTWDVLGDGGDCAFLNDEGRACSSRCHGTHHFICSKPDAFTYSKRV